MKLLIFLTTLIIFSGCSKSSQTNLTSKYDLNQLRLAQSEYENSIAIVKESKVKSGQGFFQAMQPLGIDGSEALGIINALRDSVEFSKLKVGDQLKAVFNYKNELMKFSFSNMPAELHVIHKDQESKKWTYQFIEEETFWSTRLITEKLRAGSTLQDDLIATGLSRKVAAEVINVLLCKVNFRLDARMGDEYTVLLEERHYQGRILETKVLYTSYKGKRAGSYQAYLYNDGDKKSTYNAHYTEDGEALIRSGLRYPVKRLHIRSGYGMRRHPVTGKRKMHRGVDFRGRVGTPVYAVANGVVVQSTFTKFGGNKVAIRHADSSISYYLHLHKRFVKKGQRVKSHQQIGQIGATGRVTGPHLHFGFKKANGRWMNPMHKRMIATPKLKGERLTKLQDQIAQTKIVLENARLQKVSSRAPASTDETNLTTN